jgi:hypothetical protein
LTYPSEKYEFVNGKDYPIYEMENKKCSKPPTRYIYITLYITYKPTYLHAFTNEIWGVNIGQTVT